MAYCEFLTGLFEDGRVTVPNLSPLTPETLADGDAVIASHEQAYRLETPATAPPLHVEASRWAGERFYRACQLAVYRDYDQTTVAGELDTPWLDPQTADVCYSVDLVFRFLPDLVRFASSASLQDPLLEYLRAWAHSWPLSSVGMDVKAEDLDADAVDRICSDECLQQIYADRIIATGDKSRLSNVSARRAVQCAIGSYTELSPKLAAALSEHESKGAES